MVGTVAVACSCPRAVCLPVALLSSSRDALSQHDFIWLPLSPAPCASQGINSLARMRTAVKSQVDLEYVLGVGGFDLER